MGNRHTLEMKTDVEYTEKMSHIKYIIINTDSGEYTEKIHFENFPNLEQILILSELTDEGWDQLKTFEKSNSNVSILSKRYDGEMFTFDIYGDLTYDISYFQQIFMSDTEKINAIIIRNNSRVPDYFFKIFPHLNYIRIDSQQFNAKLDLSRNIHLQHLIIDATKFDNEIILPKKGNLEFIDTLRTNMTEPLTIKNHPNLKTILLHHSKLLLKLELPNLEKVSIDENYPYDIAESLDTYGRSLKQLHVYSGYLFPSLDLRKFENLKEIYMDENYKTKIIVYDKNVCVKYKKFRVKELEESKICTCDMNPMTHIHDGPTILDKDEFEQLKSIDDLKNFAKSTDNKSFQVASLVQKYLEKKESPRFKSKTKKSKTKKSIINGKCPKMPKNRKSDNSIRKNKRSI